MNRLEKIFVSCIHMHWYCDHSRNQVYIYRLLLHLHPHPTPVWHSVETVHNLIQQRLLQNNYYFLIKQDKNTSAILCRTINHANTHGHTRICRYLHTSMQMISICWTWFNVLWIGFDVDTTTSDFILFTMGTVHFPLPVGLSWMWSQQIIQINNRNRTYGLFEGMVAYL